MHAQVGTRPRHYVVYQLHHRKGIYPLLYYKLHLKSDRMVKAQSSAATLRLLVVKAKKLDHICPPSSLQCPMTTCWVDSNCSKACKSRWGLKQK